jgi:hypothetical protein
LRSTGAIVAILRGYTISRKSDALVPQTCFALTTPSKIKTHKVIIPLYNSKLCGQLTAEKKAMRLEYAMNEVFRVNRNIAFKALVDCVDVAEKWYYLRKGIPTSSLQTAESASQGRITW